MDKSMSGPAQDAREARVAAQEATTGVRRLTMILSLFMLTLIALVVAAAMATDIFKVEYNGTTRFQVDDKGTATINADTNAADVALRILSAPNSRGDIKFMVRTSDPTSPQAGDMWYNSTDRVFKMYDGSFRIPLGLLTPQIAIDSTANGNNGTLGTNSDMLRDSADPVWTSTAKLGGSALSFDGADDYVNAGAGGSLNFGTGNFSVEAWVKTSDGTTASWKGIVGKWSASATGYFLQYYPSTKSWAWGWDGATFLNPTKDISNGIWHHIVGVRTGLTSAELYVDGVLAGSIMALTSTTSDTTENLNIGRMSVGLGRYFSSSIDEVAVWNRALTPAEVSARWNGGAGAELVGNEAGLVSVWHMNDPK